MLLEDGYGPIDDPAREYDLFICHATENKDFVRPLVDELRQHGVRPWFDETEIKLGDSLRESIDFGLTRSRFGVVILSTEFFAKRWTTYELNGLVSREMLGRKVILPVWHPRLIQDEIVEHSPTLADKKALIGRDMPVGDIAQALADIVHGEPDD